MDLLRKNILPESESDFRFVKIASEYIGALKESSDISEQDIEEMVFLYARTYKRLSEYFADIDAATQFRIVTESVDLQLDSVRHYQDEQKEFSNKLDNEYHDLN